MGGQKGVGDLVNSRGQKKLEAEKGWETKNVWEAIKGWEPGEK